MRPSEKLFEERESVPSILDRFGASNPRLFGSVARGDDQEDSDIDLIVDLPQDASYFTLFRIEDALQALLGTEVEVHTPARVGSRFAARISADLRSL